MDGEAVDAGLKNVVDEDGRKVFTDICDEHAFLFEANAINAFGHINFVICMERRTITILNFLAVDQYIDQRTADLAEYAKILSYSSKGFFNKFLGIMIGEKMDIENLDSVYKKSGDDDFYSRAMSFGNIEMDPSYIAVLQERIFFYKDFEKLLKLSEAYNKIENFFDTPLRF